MSFHCTIERDSFYEGLASLQNITNKKGTMAILSNVLIETQDKGVLLTGTDLEVGLRLFIPAQIHKEGAITLPSKKLFEIVRESGADVINLKEGDNNWVTISTDHSVYNLAGMIKSDFPDFPKHENENFVEFQSYIFLDLIDKVIFSIANEQENIYSLNSVLFESERKEDGKAYLRMISSDGHRLSIMEKDVASDIDELQLKNVILIPKKGIQEWKKFCENRDVIQLAFEKKQMIVKDKDAIMIIRLKNGDFPQYRNILEAIELKNCIQIERCSFLDSLKRINILTEDIFHAIKLKIENNKITLTSHSADFGDAKDEQKIEYDGEPLKLGFNCRYFIETLQVMECEKIKAYINSNNSPCLICSDDDKGFVSIVMPMQL